MEKFNSYWPIYKNFEEEILQLTKYINFSDDQLKVYSMHISDLILRIVVEIESLSKELYKINGGEEVFDDYGNPRDPFFDTDCINYLNNIWGICNRDIIISCAYFNFSSEDYKIFKPLKNAYKRGSSSAKWNRAYQAVKHDRRNNLKKGNIENLIYALGALFVLNIYYKDDTFDYGTTSSHNILFDNRLGSEIFAASFADASKISIGLSGSDNDIDIEEKKKLSSSLCIIKYTNETWIELHKELVNYNKKISNDLTINPIFIQNLKEKINNNGDIESSFKSVFNEMQRDYVQNNPPINFGKVFNTGKIQVVLNKNQTVYPNV